MTDSGLPGEDRSIVPGAVPNAEPPVARASEPTDRDGVVSDVIEDDARTAARGRLGWLSITVAIVFGLFYAYALFAAISAIVDFPQSWTAVGLDSGDAPWVFPIVTVALPIVIFALAFWVGLRRNVFGKALIFILGLVAVATLTTSLDVFADAALASAQSALPRFE